MHTARYVLPYKNKKPTNYLYIGNKTVREMQICSDIRGTGMKVVHAEATGRRITLYFINLAHSTLVKSDQVLSRSPRLIYKASALLGEGKRKYLK